MTASTPIKRVRQDNLTEPSNIVEMPTYQLAILQRQSVNRASSHLTARSSPHCYAVEHLIKKHAVITAETCTSLQAKKVTPWHPVRFMGR